MLPAAMRSSTHQEAGPVRVPAQEIDGRTSAIREAMQSAGADGMLVVQRADLFYFSGTAQNAFLYLSADHEPVLFVKQYLPRARRESALKHIVAIDSVRQIPQLVRRICGRLPRTLAFELDVLPVNDYRFYRDLFAPRSVMDGSPLILKQRRIKSDWEIERMEETAAMTRSTFDYMRECICPGMTEMEFAGRFETYARTLGHGGSLRVRHFQTEGYPWHVLSGRSGGQVGLLDSPASGEGTSAAFPVGAGHKPLAPDEAIMVDLGSVKNGYHLDETRMFAIGKMPAKARDASLAAIEIHDRVLAAAGPGVTVGELFDLAVAEADRLGYRHEFLGPPDHKVAFIGHGIGVELIEPPIMARGRDIPLEPGMTLALEPKLVFADEFAAGIESVFAVTAGGTRLISQVPVNIFIC